MRLTDLFPEWCNHVPLGTGIAFGVAWVCSRDLLRQRRHSVCFMPPINPYPNLAAKLAQVPVCGCPKWTRLHGETFDTLTLSPSIGSHDYRKQDKPECCHINITNGEVIP